MPGLKTKVVVKILDEEYNVKGESSPEHIEALAIYVDRKMRQVAGSDSRISGNKAAVLTALNIADELFKLQKEYERLVGRINEKR